MKQRLRYIKVNRKVVESVGLHRDRPELPDGNFAIFVGDLSYFGPLSAMERTVARIGGVWMDGPALRGEQQRTACLELPEPEEEKYRMSDSDSAEDDGCAEDDADASGDSEPEEMPVEGAEA